MLIGIDFDNTIACYDLVFDEIARKHGFISQKAKVKGKIEIRDFLLGKPEGKKIWMKLQGLVYGKYMHRAQIMPMIANFLIQCKKRSCRVVIISHKTEFGHYDTDKIPLRREAKKWMMDQNFFNPSHFALSEKDVHFASTATEKVSLIDELNCDVFIDDLPKIFELDHFPKHVEKILLNRSFSKIKPNEKYKYKICQSWNQISDLLYGEVSTGDLISWVEHCYPITIKKISKKTGRRNSRIYQIKDSSDTLYAMKLYPDKFEDSRNRLRTEFTTVEFLKRNKFDNIPEAIAMCADLNLGLYSWIEGYQIEQPKIRDLEQAIEFIERLYLLSKNSDRMPDLATEACLSASELINQVQVRLNRLLEILESNWELNDFITNQFIPIWEKSKRKALRDWPSNSIDLDLENSYLTLSPSDFGFHNSIKSGNHIYFIDFEYFGRDDPVKLTADFIWHPGMRLSEDLLTKWSNEMLHLFSSDPSFEARLRAAMPLYGLRWIMIILNDFLPNITKYYQGKLTPIDNRKKIQLAQLEKAKKYCEKLEEMGYY